MPTKYVHFTDEQKEQARQTNLCELLRSQGETLKRSGTEYEWKDGSQKVTIRGNLWFHQYDRQGGDAIDFVKRFYNKEYPEAVSYLLGSRNGTLSVSPSIERKPPKPFELPPRNENMRRVYAYLLSKRGLDRDVVNTFAYKQMIYAGKLLSGHTLRCSRFLNCLSYRRKIEVKVVVSCVHKLTTYPLKILLLYFTEMRLLIERCEISCNRICNLRLQET